MSTRKKVETHERIVEQAARAIRRDGYEGVSVADIMKEAGLTHGGFYAHFDSREALVEEALERAAAESLPKLLAGGGGLAELAQRYLSDEHEKNLENGCVLAGLGSETRRQSHAVRAISARQVRAFVSLIEGLVPKRADSQARQEEARVILSALVGALVLSRAVDNPELSKSVRSAVTQFVNKKAR